MGFYLWIRCQLACQFGSGCCDGGREYGAETDTDSMAGLCCEGAVVIILLSLLERFSGSIARRGYLSLVVAFMPGGKPAKEKDA